MGDENREMDTEKDKVETMNEKTEYMTVDDVLIEVGQMGRFQKLTMLSFSLLLLLPAYNSMITVFIAEDPGWKCQGNSSECSKQGVFFDNRRCSMKPESWTFARDKDFSIVTEFDLVCDRKILSYAATSAIFVGQTIGTFIMGYLSDRYGRKKTLFPCLFGLVVCGFACSFSPNVYVFIGLRIVVGLFFAGMIVTSMVMSVELVGPKYRALAGVVIWNSWGLAMLSMNLLSWLLQNWMLVNIVLSAPFILLMALHRFIPESVRWLRTQGRLDEALQIFQRVAKINKRTLKENVRIEAIKENDDISASYKDLFANKKIALKSLAFMVLWFTTELVYFTISLASGDFTGNVNLDFAVVMILDVPSNLTSILIMNRLGRKKGCLIAFSIVGTSLLTYATLQAFDIHLMPVRLTLVIIAKSFAVMSWCSTEIWSSESYPTSVRSQALALFYMMSTLADVLGPWVAKWLKGFYTPLPFFIMGGFVALSVLLSCFLEESKGKHFADVLHKEKLNQKENAAYECEMTTTM